MPGSKPGTISVGLRSHWQVPFTLAGVGSGNHSQIRMPREPVPMARHEGPSENTTSN